MPPSDALLVSQVFVGQPSLLGHRRGRPVTSSIRKQPVTSETLALGPTGLDGDRQADPTVHGGADKAVYVYPAENYPQWEADGYNLAEGRVGENVSSQGWTEADVHVGDVWRWGKALVQVSQPRAPCPKFGLHVGRDKVIAAMQRSGRCGWYLRVLEPGSVPTTGTMDLVERDPEAPTVATLFALRFPASSDGADDPAELQRMLAMPTVIGSWRDTIAQKLARLESH